MNILFLVYHGFSEISGITKKIKAQIEGLRENGHTVYVCTYSIIENGHRCRMIDNEVLQDFGTGRLAAIRKRISYKAIYTFCVEKKIKVVYCRSFHNANPWTIHLFKRLKKSGIKAVMEIPTYPYDQEYVGFPLFTRLELQVDKLFRRQLASQLQRIVTFSSDKEIFGQKTICISNGISFERIPIRQEHRVKEKELTNKLPKTINLVGVAEVHYWHGFDRLIAGIGEYYKNGGKLNIQFHIIGGVGPSEMYNSQHAPGFQELIDKYGIASHIQFHGAMYGDELDRYFDMADFAIGSLARHRSGITDIKTLKNREYAARGIPFIYSEHDEDFEDKPYILKASADETPVDILSIIDFINNNTFAADEIRASIKELSWKYQMKRVIDSIYPR